MNTVDVRAYATATCGALRGLHSVMQSIQNLQPEIRGDTTPRTVLKARYAELLGAASSAAAAGAQFLEHAPLPKTSDAAEHARQVNTLLTQFAAENRTWRSEVAGFDTQDRDNWEDEVNTLDTLDMGTPEHNWDRVLAAVGAGETGRSVNAASKQLDACRTVLGPLRTTSPTTTH